jgi:pantoate--beta-alanine ligase
MKILPTISQLKNELKKYKSADNKQTIGFVPTMGYLHEGHLELVRQCKKENHRTVVSIFVNPTQFGPSEDFDTYPRDTEKDIRLLEELAVDFLFFPDLPAMYPDGYRTYVEVEKLDKVLCGKSRPTHFRGVTTIVLKLFNIVTPDRAYFGRKDAQQAIIIKKMATDLDLDITIRTIPIVRDPDGLALSSRNVYLSARERAAALAMPRALQKMKKEIQNGLEDAHAAKRIFQDEVAGESLLEIDYIEIVTLNGLEPTGKIDINNTLVAAAVRVGKTRLIDNFILGEI